MKALTEGASDVVNIVMEAVEFRTEGFEPDKEGQSYVLRKCNPEPPVNEHVNPNPPNEGLPEERVPFIHPPNPRQIHIRTLTPTIDTKDIIQLLKKKEK